MGIAIRIPAFKYTKKLLSFHILYNMRGTIPMIEVHLIMKLRTIRIVILVRSLVIVGFVYLSRVFMWADSKK